MVTHAECPTCKCDMVGLAALAVQTALQAAAGSVEVERLRAALEEIAESCENWGSKNLCSGGEQMIHRTHARMARKALAAAPPTAPGAGGTGELEVTLWPGEPWVQTRGRETETPFCRYCRALYTGDGYHAPSCLFIAPQAAGGSPRHPSPPEEAPHD